MNPEIKAKWLAALRSGEYQQGQNWLKNGKGGFCCLGVLCDLYRKEIGKGGWEIYYESRIFTLDDAKAPYYPPTRVIDWAGLGESWEALNKIRITIDGTENSLAEHNDQGKTFSQIADAIEDQIPGDEE